MDVRVTNRSDARVWPGFSDGRLDVGVLVLWRAGKTVDETSGAFIPLRRQLGPGEWQPLRESIAAPAVAGNYDLEISIVQNLGDAGRFGGASLTVPVVVK